MPRHPMKRHNAKRHALPVKQPKARLVHPVPRKMPPQYRAK